MLLALRIRARHPEGLPASRRALVPPLSRRFARAGSQACLTDPRGCAVRKRSRFGGFSPGAGCEATRCSEPL